MNKEATGKELKVDALDDQVRRQLDCVEATGKELKARIPARNRVLRAGEKQLGKN